MMTGRVEAYHAILDVPFLTDTRGDIIAKFIIDSGFTGLLTLPPDKIALLGLAYRGEREVSLADGTPRMANIYRGVIKWHNIEYEVPVIEMAGDPLIGASLLGENAVYIELWEGGRVVVTPRNAGGI